MPILDGTIQYWLDKYDFFETELNDPKMHENMKFFIGGQTGIKVPPRTIEGMIRDVRIEEVFKSKESLSITDLTKSLKQTYPHNLRPIVILTKVSSHFERCWFYISWSLNKTPLPISRPDQIPINEEMLIDNFDLPKTFYIEFEFQLTRKKTEPFLEGMKFDSIDINNGIIR